MFDTVPTNWMPHLVCSNLFINYQYTQYISPPAIRGPSDLKSKTQELHSTMGSESTEYMEGPSVRASIVSILVQYHYHYDTFWFWVDHMECTS